MLNKNVNGDNNIILSVFMSRRWTPRKWWVQIWHVFEAHSLQPEKTQVWIPSFFWPYYLPICNHVPVEIYMISLSLSFFTCKIEMLCCA